MSLAHEHDAGLASSRVEDAALRSRLGFDRDDDRWLELAREASSEIPLGSLGRYRLLEEVGRGSQGAVYKALQPGTGRAIAIKRLAAGAFAGRQARARFEREIEAAASLSHPGVVTVFGTDEVDGQAILLMEWVDGVPLDRWAWREGQPLHPLRDRLERFVALCDAITHAHSRGVIHRDLKPSNILIDAHGHPRVLDFGLAKVLGASWERAASTVSIGTSFVGTPAYAAPEQVAENADAIDTRADVYALGVLLYQLLTGCLPFDPSLPLARIFDLVRVAEPTRTSSIRADVGPELDCIVRMAMAKRREDRYQTVESFALDVRRFLRGEAVLAHPPGFAYHARKLIARHRLAFAAAGLALASLASLAIVSTTLAMRLASQGAALQASLAGEQDQRRAAEQTGEVNRQVSTFVGDMLISLGEAIARDDLDPARGMIEDAVRRLEAREVQDPVVEMQLRRQVARLAFLAGSREVGRACAERAWTLCQEHFPREHEETAKCLVQLGYLAESDRKIEDAERLDREAAEIFERTIGLDRLETAGALNNLGCVLNDLQRPDEALEVHHKALAVRTKLVGEVSPEVATSLRNIGNAHRAAGRLDEADAWLSRSLDVATRANADRTTRQNIEFNIARLRASQQRHDEAIAILRELLEGEVAARGPRTLLAARCHAYIARSFEALGKLDEAIASNSLAYECYRDSVGPTHAYTITMPYTMGRLNEKLRRPERAVESYRLALDLAKRIEPPALDTVKSRVRALAKCLRSQQREHDAQAVEGELAEFERASNDAARPSPTASPR